MALEDAAQLRPHDTPELFVGGEIPGCEDRFGSRLDGYPTSSSALPKCVAVTSG
jgi:hypothetical protein